MRAKTATNIWGRDGVGGGMSEGGAAIIQGRVEALAAAAREGHPSARMYASGARHVMIIRKRAYATA